MYRTGLAAPVIGHLIGPGMRNESPWISRGEGRGVAACVVSSGLLELPAKRGRPLIAGDDS